MFATGTKGLLVWCKQITSKYGDDVEVKNMTTSFKNGLAFCAIIHHFRSDLIDFKNLSKENVAANNALAFRVAEEELDIPALLDVEDMVEMKVPDKLSIMTYVSQYYNYFKDKVPGEIEVKKYGSKKRVLVKDKHDVIPSKKSNDSSKQNAAGGVAQKSNVCRLCEKKVFLMERLTVESKLFHRICFKCSVCGVQLKTSTYEYDRNTGLFYCSRDFKNRGVVRQEPIGSDGSSVMSVEITESGGGEMPKVADNPFKRNEQFVRKGIRPQASPAEMEWEKRKVVKSKSTEQQQQKQAGAAEKPAKSGKISFPGLKKNKKKAESTKDSREFTNPSYQQQLELSKYMDTLDAQNTDQPSRPSDANERIVVGSEATVNYDDGERSGTLSGLQIGNAAPVQKFRGETEMDHASSTEVTGKSNKKKKLVFKVKKKFKKGKDGVDSTHDNSPSSKDIVMSPEHTTKTNLYTDFKAEKATADLNKSQSSSSADYENIEHFRDSNNDRPVSSHHQELFYANGQIVSNQVVNEEEEVYENDPERMKESSKPAPVHQEKAVGEGDIGVYEPPSSKQRHRKWSEEEHYKVPMKVITMERSTQDATDEDNKVKAIGNVKYQDARSKLKRVQVLEKDINEKAVDTTLGDSYLNARSKLRNSNRTFSFSPPSSKSSVIEDDRNSAITTTTSPSSSEDSSSIRSPFCSPLPAAVEVNTTLQHNSILPASSISSSVLTPEHEINGTSPETTAVDENNIGTTESITMKNGASISAELEETFGGDEEVNTNPFDDDFEVGNDNTSVDNNDDVSSQDLLDDSDTNIDPSPQSTVHTTTQLQPTATVLVDSPQEDNHSSSSVGRTLGEGENATERRNDCVADGGTISDMSDAVYVVKESKDEDDVVMKEDSKETMSSASKSVGDDVNDDKMVVDDVNNDKMVVDNVVGTLKDQVSRVKQAKDTNPFEDCDDDVDDHAMTRTNPFDDSDDEPQPTSTTTTPKESNPFFSSSEDDEDFDESNPFADDVRNERKHRTKDEDTNPFAEDAREELRHQATSSSSTRTPFQRNSGERLSLQDRSRLKKIGVDVSNPFADDLLEDEDDDDDVAIVQSPNKKKLILKTKTGKKARAAPPRPNAAPARPNTAPAQRPPPPSLAQTSSSAVQTPRSVKKRAAPKAPPLRPAASPVLDPNSSLRRSLKKRLAPRPPQQQQGVTSSSSPVPSKPPRRDSSKPTAVLPTEAEYANVLFKNGAFANIKESATTKTDDDDHEITTKGEAYQDQAAIEAEEYSVSANEKDSTIEPPLAVTIQGVEGQAEVNKGSKETSSVEEEEGEEGEPSDQKKLEETLDEVSVAATTATGAVGDVVVEGSSSAIEVPATVECHGDNIVQGECSNLSSESAADTGIAKVNDQEGNDDSLTEQLSEDGEQLSEDDKLSDNEDEDDEFFEDALVSDPTLDEEASNNNMNDEDTRDEEPRSDEQQHQGNSKDKETSSPSTLDDEDNNDNTEVLESQNQHQQERSSPSTPTTLSTPSTPLSLSRDGTGKRKAPVRPPPPERMESLDDSEVSGNIALRDKQPRRKEIEFELRELETKQRQLELEGVAMEKKLRQSGEDEPEDAYLLTWFELVNQKNLLLRRENELIYMAQELDLLQNQRHAEFELRQIMMKSEHEKTEADRDREEELLADILKMVTQRSNIVDKMDEDRLREYEEDEEVLHMMQAQGLKPTPTKEGAAASPPIQNNTTQQNKTKKEKKNKKDKKEKVKKEKRKKK